MDLHLSAARATVTRAIRRETHAWRGASWLRTWAREHWEWLLIGAILLISGLAHGINMFNFPYYENDEGTYVSQGWAILHQGQLAPYTYWYDHAPAGWILIALWGRTTGGFSTFGMTVASGRVLMLILQLASTFMLYRIARAISGSALVATLAALLFALSPYGIYFHRRVLLDNIATFWMLLAILLLVSGRLTLSRVWASAAALGIAILSKELTIFLVPGLAYLVWGRAQTSQRPFALPGWLALVGSIVSLYVLMAVVKGELFPTGTSLGGTASHVSLLGALAYQASRGKDGGLLDFNSGFWGFAKTWARDEPLLVLGGSASAIVSALAIRWWRLPGIMGVLALSLWAFLGRGGETLRYYLVPLLPLLALNVALVLGLVVGGLNMRCKSRIGNRGPVVAGAIGFIAASLCLIGLLVGYSSPDLQRGPDLQGGNLRLLWTGTQTVAQRQTVDWILSHVPSSSKVVVDDAIWLDLHATHPYAQWHWRVDLDPAIQNGVFHDDWRNIDYIVVSAVVWQNAVANHLTLVSDALGHCTVVTRFDTGGWPIEICKVNKGSGATQGSLQGTYPNTSGSPASGGPQARSYTVQLSDTLASVAQKLGLPDWYQDLYLLNQSAIEAAAQRHGYPGSDNGAMICAGTELIYPQPYTRPPMRQQ